MKAEQLEKIYLSRPFKIRNADEYDLENILDLFIDPTDGLIGPFDFSNVIVKGKMGSGKTMYLRANYAYYLHTLVPCLIEKNPIILPVYIKLSDFQSIKNPEEIYNAVLIRILEELVAVCNHLNSADELARLHTGALTLTGLWSTNKALNKITDELKKLSATEYVEKISNEIEAKGSFAKKFFDAFASFNRSTEMEIKTHYKPSFSDIVDACKTLLEPFNGKLLILFDEIGSISKSFFKSDENGDSFFETMMNQFRTLSYVRTKLAVYPNSYSDILKETRYGDVVSLECDIITQPEQYSAYSIKILTLIERYISKVAECECHAETIFEITPQDQKIIEQLLNASEGNMRRMVHLLDASMNEAYKVHAGKARVSEENVLSALKKQGADMEALYSAEEIEFLKNITKLCKSRSTYRFSYPNKGSLISKFTTNSSEFNIVEISQNGTGRKGTVYYFDYAYCIYKDLPTHYIKNSERIDRSRSRITGDPIRRVAQLSDELLFQSAIPGKIDGNIVFMSNDNKSGFILGSDSKQYFFSERYILKSDIKKNRYMGCKVRFLPSVFPPDQICAAEIEIL